MIGVGIGIMFAGYAVGSYGWVLVKGYNITPRQWFSPLNPFVWPAPGADIPRVPKGHIFPTSSATAAASSGGGSHPVPNVNAL